MFDIGWPEFAVIAVVTILVMGPHELPRMLRAVRGIIRKLRMIAGDFQKNVDDLVREADMEDARNYLRQFGEDGVKKQAQALVDPDGEIDRSVGDLQRDLGKLKQDAAARPPAADGKKGTGGPDIKAPEAKGPETGGAGA